MNPLPLKTACLLACSVATLVGCSSSNDPSDPNENITVIPQLSAATAATRSASCEDLTTAFTFENTSITAAETVAAGTLTIANNDITEHCVVTGKMYERTSDVDGNDYAIGFEMRLPTEWNGRYFYQANGGIDGSVKEAVGVLVAGGPLSHALRDGFAVISSDTGHGPGPVFGYDPQARLDYGYQAVGKLTPMAKALIEQTYGKAPDRSYIGGCSNGGRHTLVAATRYPNDYDGFLIGAPGYNLPLAATANIAGAQLYASIAGTDSSDISTAVTTAERQVIVDALLSKCDALDGIADGLIQDREACQTTFDLETDVSTCSADRDGSCLSTEQKSVLSKIFAGVKTSTGDTIYASFPWDAGIASPGVQFWEYTASINLDSGAVGMIFQSPPAAEKSTFDDSAFTLTSNIDDLVTAINDTTDTFTESGMSFMTPVNPTDLSVLKNRGAKIMTYHGTSDAIFSFDDSKAWMDGLAANNEGDASDFAKFYPVPNMGHCSGGPSVDQFEMLSELVAWVEEGTEPAEIIASARGTDNIGGANDELPASWSATRTRPLCAYPLVATYDGSGDIETAASFSCQ